MDAQREEKQDEKNQVEIPRIKDEGEREREGREEGEREREDGGGRRRRRGEEDGLEMLKRDKSNSIILTI